MPVVLLLRSNFSKMDSMRRESAGSSDISVAPTMRVRSWKTTITVRSELFAEVSRRGGWEQRFCHGSHMLPTQLEDAMNGLGATYSGCRCC